MAEGVFYSNSRLTTRNGQLVQVEPETNIRLDGGAALPLGTAAQATTNGWSGWSLPATGTSGAQFARSLPLTWGAAALSWGYRPVAGTGNVRWRVSVFRVNALGFGDLISDAAQTIDTFTQAMGTTDQLEHVFNHPTTFPCHNTDGFVGEVCNFNIERLGDDAADTAAGALVLTNYSLTFLN
jgi:hypothetical protein